MGRYEEQRKFLKSNFNEFKNIKTDKMKGISQPDATKPYDKLCEVVALPQVNMEVLKNPNIYKCIAERRSTRFYSDEAMSIEELSYLLWATQGITGTNKVGLILRTVPCSGATHSFETYLFIMNVEGIKKEYIDMIQ